MSGSYPDPDMGNSRKRPLQDNNNEGKYQKRRHFNKENPGDGLLAVYRILCLNSVIGGIIGEGGEVISMLQQVTHARIMVVDPFPGADKRVITIYCYVKDKDPENVDEYGEKPLCPAQDALLRVHTVHSAIASAVANGTNDSDKKQREGAHLLVPDSQAARVIGKDGDTIKRIRSKTGANIKFRQKNPSDPTHSCAMSFDNFIQITGDSEAVKNALYAISAIMYKFSSEEEISLETTIPELHPLIIPSDVPIYPAVYSGAGAMPSHGNFLPLRGAMPSHGNFLPDRGAMPSHINFPPVRSAMPTHVVPVRGAMPSRGNFPPVQGAMPSHGNFPPVLTRGAAMPSHGNFPPVRTRGAMPSHGNFPPVRTRGAMPSHGNFPPVRSATTQVPLLHEFVDTNSGGPMYSSALPVVSGYGGLSRSKELVVRILCPFDKIGRVIGKGGSTIKNIMQASGAHIDVDDKKHDTGECVITVTSTESAEDMKSAAVEAVSHLLSEINDEDDERVNIHLLVPSKVIGCLIGKNGAIINEMRKKTKADVSIYKDEKSKRAAPSDELVEVSGEVSNIRDALIQIVLRLREDVLKDKDGSHANPPIESQYSTSHPVPPALPSVPPASRFGYDQNAEAERRLGMSSSRSIQIQTVKFSTVWRRWI